MTPKATADPGPGGPAREGKLTALAELALDTLAGLEPELRQAAVISDQGEVLATTAAGEAWGRAAVELLKVLEAAGDGELDSSHVATQDAEVFVVRESGFALIALTERFVLASLTSFDVRMSLRDLAAENARQGGQDA